MKAPRDAPRVQLAALRLTPLRSAIVFSLVLAAFSSFRLVVRDRTISSWPSSSAQAIKRPVTGNFVMFNGLGVRDDGCVQHGHRDDGCVQHGLVYAPAVSSASLMMPSMAGHLVPLGSLPSFSKAF